MNIKLFLEYRPWLRKPDFYYKLKGFENGWSSSDVSEAIAGQIEQYSVKRRTFSLELPEAPSEIRYLYEEYEIDNVCMLWTNFWSEPRKLEQGWGFADMSETNIVLAPSGRIEAYNAHPIRAIPGSTDCLGVLAKDLESYLEAMLYGQMNATHFISGFPDEDPILYEKTVLVAKHCALIAGGYQYYDFWAGILGLPPADDIPE